MRIIIIIILIVTFVSGCGRSLKNLMEFDAQQQEIARHVEAERRKFNLLLSDVKEDKLKVGEIDKESIINLYGEPIVEKDLGDQESLLYRDPLDFFPEEKVYLFFDSSDILERYEIKSGKF
ncbi:hypothetical protein ACFL96_08260 [Thermoproteota archaeon]